MKDNTRPILLRLAVVAAAAMTLNASASSQCRQFLYFAKTPVFADNIPTCYTRALGTMTQSGYGGVRRGGDEVTGTKGGAYASITCVDTKPRSTAVVMVVSGDQGEAQRVRDELRAKVAKAQGL